LGAKRGAGSQIAVEDKLHNATINWTADKL